MLVGMLEKAFFVAEYDAVNKTGASGEHGCSSKHCMFVYVTV